MTQTIKHASLTAQERAARQQDALVPSQHPDEAAETGTPIGVIGRSALRHRPLGKRYLIPMSDGTQLHVTEWELATMGLEYHEAAQLLAPCMQPAAPLQLSAPKSRRQPHPKRPLHDESIIYAGPATTHARETDAFPTQRQRPHWMLLVGVSMIATVAIWLGVLWVGAWWQVQQDDWHYGRPRTFQIDANVGHGTAQDPNSHFIALNLHRHIEVIEIPADDASKTKIYVGPTLIGASEDLTPVTLSFEDVNHDGRPDLVIHLADSKYIFLNTGTDFKAAPNQ